MLSRQAIFQAYFHGPQAIISLITQHLGEEVLAPPPTVLALQHTIEGINMLGSPVPHESLHGLPERHASPLLSSSAFQLFYETIVW